LRRWYDVALDRSFDAVVCLFSSIGSLTSTEELDEAVGAMSRHLNPGGVLIVDGWIRPDYDHAFGSAGLAVETVECPLPGRHRYVGVSSGAP
jgi:SAM-dependent methyltransferase